MCRRFIFSQRFLWKLTLICVSRASWALRHFAIIQCCALCRPSLHPCYLHVNDVHCFWHWSHRDFINECMERHKQEICLKKQTNKKAFFPPTSFIRLGLKISIPSFSRVESDCLSSCKQTNKPITTVAVKATLKQFKDMNELITIHNNSVNVFGLTGWEDSVVMGLVGGGGVLQR